VFVSIIATDEETVLEPNTRSWQYAPNAMVHLAGTTVDGTYMKR
jgi:virulence-associated protein VagC